MVHTMMSPNRTLPALKGGRRGESERGRRVRSRAEIALGRGRRKGKETRTYQHVTEAQAKNKYYRSAQVAIVGAVRRGAKAEHRPGLLEDGGDVYSELLEERGLVVEGRARLVWGVAAVGGLLRLLRPPRVEGRRHEVQVSLAWLPVVAPLLSPVHSRERKAFASRFLSCARSSLRGSVRFSPDLNNPRHAKLACGWRTWQVTCEGERETLRTFSFQFGLVQDENAFVSPSAARSRAHSPLSLESTSALTILRESSSSSSRRAITA